MRRWGKLKPKGFLWTKLYPADVLMPEVGLVVYGILLKDGPMLLTHNAMMVVNHFYVERGPPKEDTWFVRNVKSMYRMEYDCVCFIARWPGYPPPQNTQQRSQQPR